MTCNKLNIFFALSIIQGKATSTSTSTLFNKNIDYNRLARKIADQLKENKVKGKEVIVNNISIKAKMLLRSMLSTSFSCVTGK